MNISRSVHPAHVSKILKLADCPSISQCRVFLSLRGDQHVDRSQQCLRFSRQRNSLDHHGHFDLGLCQWTLQRYLAIRVGMARGTSPCCHLNQSYAFVPSSPVIPSVMSFTQVLALWLRCEYQQTNVFLQTHTDLAQPPSCKTITIQNPFVLRDTK